MRISHFALLPVCAAVLLLAACSNGGGGGGSPPPITNPAPTANAGPNQSVTSGATVTLNGGASSDNGSIAAYAWSHTGGTPAITLSSTTAITPTFNAPLVATATAFTFSLIVTDNQGLASAASAVIVTVNPPGVGNGNVTGRVTYERIPFNTATNLGLNYAGGTQVPARGIIVEALGTGPIPLATATTDANGDYTLSVPANTTVTVRAVARLANWNARVQDADVAQPSPYTFSSPSFNSNTGTQNIAIPSGLSATGQATGTRASAPFAVLDTIYQCIQLVLNVAPSTTFPALVVDWAADNPGGETYFDPNIDTIVLSATLSEDTDEFDQHVIAHEFGHYIEFNFSRADNIGGGHGEGDKLDIRTAYGEGFGYAFGAIVLNNPVTRDSVVRNGIQESSTFNVETNPTGSNGCWCSETSVWSILWDVFDSAADANDSLALGFAPIWNVVTGSQRTTDAVTSIFPFVTSLKLAEPTRVAAINTLVSAQNIDSASIDAFASTETHIPPAGSVANTAAVLPLYSTVNVGGAAAVVMSSGLPGTPGLNHNKLGNHRFVRFVHDGSPSSLTVTVTTNGSDADFLVFRQGSVVAVGLDPPAPSEVATINNAVAGTYVIDVYECANGCSPGDQQGAGPQGNYSLAVTVN